MILLAAALLALPISTDHVVPGEFATIQAALDAAQCGDRIFVGPGTWSEPLVLATSGVALIGSGVGSTILSGGGSARVLDVTADDFELTGVTIEDGLSLSAFGGGRPAALSGGAGLRVVGNGTHVHDVWFEGNEAMYREQGAALLIDGDRSKIEHTTFFANGGDFLVLGCAAALSGNNQLVAWCTFDHNGGDYSPCMGLSLDGVGTMVTDCLFTGQFGQSATASLRMSGAEHSVVNCDFTDTNGEYSGAIYSAAEDCLLENIFVTDNYEGPISISGSTHVRGLTIRNLSSNYGDAGLTVFGSGGGSADRVVIQTAGNTAWTRGISLYQTSFMLHDVLLVRSDFNAPIHIVDSVVLVEGCTIADNLTSFRNEPGSLNIESESTVYVRDSVLWNPLLPSEVTIDSSALAFAHCMVQGDMPGTNMVLADDPLFQGNSSDPLVAYRPRTGSPLIDAGDPNLPGLRLDLLLGVRKIDGDLDGVACVDLGAIEHTQTSLSFTRGVDGATTLLLDGPEGALGALVAGTTPKLATLGPWGILCVDLDLSLHTFATMALLPLEVTLPPEAFTAAIAQGLAFDFATMIGQVSNPLLLSPVTR